MTPQGDYPELMRRGFNLPPSLRRPSLQAMSFQTGERSIRKQRNYLFGDPGKAPITAGGFDSTRVPVTSGNLIGWTLTSQNRGASNIQTAIQSTTSDVRSVNSRNDKRYFELVITQFAGGAGTFQIGLGICNASHNSGFPALNGVALGNDLFSAAYKINAANSGTLLCATQGSTNAGFLAALGDTLQIAYDPVASNFWAGKNGTGYYGGGNPATGTLPLFGGALGIIGPVFACCCSDSVNGQQAGLGHFTAATCQFAIPVGYKAWDDP